jgi:hypothetical protein
MPPPPNFSMMRKWEIVRPESGEESGIAANVMPRPIASQQRRITFAAALVERLSLEIRAVNARCVRDSPTDG